MRRGGERERSTLKPESTSTHLLKTRELRKVISREVGTLANTLQDHLSDWTVCAQEVETDAPENPGVNVARRGHS